VRGGARVTIVIVTDGSSAQYPGDEAVLRQKQEQAVEAARVLGCESVVQLDFPDMRLDGVPHVELNAALQRLVDEHAADTVFVHHPTDVNLDHRRIFESTLVATRPTPDSPVRQLIAYEVNSSTEWGARTPLASFRPDLYIDISDTLELKLAALERYQGELRPWPHPRSLDAVRERARVRGAEAGLAAAEAFELVFMRGTVMDVTPAQAIARTNAPGEPRR
jgi:LmbE family N-acetylglucosaminyl deacetylase